MQTEKIETIIKVAKRTAPKFTFGIYDVDDIFQEAVMIGMEGASRYEENRGEFENFISTHIYNRLCTLRTKHTAKPPPDNESSLEYMEWYRTQGVKHRLTEPVYIEQDNLFDEPKDTLDIQELSKIIDKELPAEYREDYLRMIQGVKLPSNKEEQIREVIIGIAKHYGYHIQARPDDQSRNEIY